MAVEPIDVATHLEAWIARDLNGRPSGEGTTFVAYDDRSRTAILNARCSLLTRYVSARVVERGISIELTRFETRAVRAQALATRVWCDGIRRRIDAKHERYPSP